MSLQLNVEDFAPASNDEKKSLVVMRESVNFWKDGLRRLRKNKIAMFSLVVIILIAIFAYVLPSFWPYSYEQQIKGSNNLAPFAVFCRRAEAHRLPAKRSSPTSWAPTVWAVTIAVRVMMGTRVSLSVGLLASVLVLLIGATYGAVSAFAGGWVDNIMMRITDIFYTIPDILHHHPAGYGASRNRWRTLADPARLWLDADSIGAQHGVHLHHLCSCCTGSAWRVSCAAQVLTLKESEYVTAARALGAVRRPHHQKAPADQLHRHPDRYHHAADPLLHLYRELPELPGSGRCGPHAVSGLLWPPTLLRVMNTYPVLPDRPRVDDQPSMILVFNLFGDGLRDAFDPKLKS